MSCRQSRHKNVQLHMSDITMGIVTTVCNDVTLIGHSPSGSCQVFTSGTEMIDNNIPVQTTFRSVVLDGPVAFTTGIPCVLEDTVGFINRKKSEHERRNGVYGEHQEMYQAMESALSWDTIYDAKHDRIISPVSRLWSIRNGGYVLFCWDIFFAGYMAAWGDKELAYSNMREILNEQTSARGHRTLQTLLFM